MVLWIIVPITLALVSFVGTWLVYGIAYWNGHVCSLSDWSSKNYCSGNKSVNCCLAPTISTSGAYAPENSLFTATINAGSFLFLLFCLLHHAHVMEKHGGLSVMSRMAAVLGLVAALGAFMAGNCNAKQWHLRGDKQLAGPLPETLHNAPHLFWWSVRHLLVSMEMLLLCLECPMPGYLALLHYLGAAVSFVCICFYTIFLTAITKRCQLSGFETYLYPYRIVASIIQAIVTICYTILFAQKEYFYLHLSAIFEWMLSVNLQLFEFSYAVEFYYFSSYMISNLLGKRDEQKPLMMSLS